MSSDTKPTEPVVLEHEYDGIREYDNPMPGWWVGLFWATIVFSVAYWVFYHVGGLGQTLEEAYQASVEAHAQLAGAEGELIGDAPTLLRLMSDAQAQQQGEKIFRAYCAACHGGGGEGLVGPNLTDDYYKNVLKIEDIVTVVTDGAANGAMPAWSSALSEADIVTVSAYIAGLRGKNLTGPRGAEGQEIPPWSADAAQAPASDSD
ncbi:MAG TPA: cbb3-type cytochrome c oxidase N-terminal domain-containing protein [Phycisphaeraceae bacterium]